MLTTRQEDSPRRLTVTIHTINEVTYSFYGPPHWSSHEVAGSIPGTSTILNVD